MAGNQQDNFEWARQLGCPESAITESVRKSLRQGISDVLWEKLSGVLYPAERVLEVRKNILLHKLRHGLKDPSLEHLRSTVELRAATAALEPDIDSLEEKCGEQDFLVRQKQQRLETVKRQRRRLRPKEDLLRLKWNELKILVEDGRQMRGICQRLMPTNDGHVDSCVIDECLLLVGAISTRSDRKMALNRISENLGGIDVATLWNGLLAKVVRDTEDLMEFGRREVSEKRVAGSFENLDVSIGKCHGRCIVSGAQEHMYNAKNEAHGKRIMEYIEKLETLEAHSPYLREWLALRLEVRKLETEEKSLETEMDVLKKILEQQPSLSDELGNLEADEHSVREQMENCMRDIKEALILLRPAGSVIARTRDKLTAVLERIVALGEDKRAADYANIDLSAELQVFYDSVDLEALDKLVLRDNVGAYRHAKLCMSGALEAVKAPLTLDGRSEFPMIRSPVYHLLNCYKTIVTSAWLAKLEDEFGTTERYDFGEGIPPLLCQDSGDDCVEMLGVTNLTCDRVRNGIAQFDSIFDAWKHQTVQKVMSMDDRIVNGATFKEWAKRYDVMLHMLRKNK